MKILKLLVFIIFFNLARSTKNEDFIFNGFLGSNLTIDGEALVSPAGVLVLTNSSTHQKSHAFYSTPVYLTRSSSVSRGDNVTVSSFSTSFVFALVPKVLGSSGKGFAFVLSPTKKFSKALANQYLGLFNTTNNGLSYNHIFAIEFDTVFNPEFEDIDDNHVGIDINGLVSVKAHTVGYYRDGDAEFEGLKLISGQTMQAWVDYDSETQRLNVTLSPFKMSKPEKPLMSAIVNLSDIVLEETYAGFSAATGLIDSYHCVLGWSFSVGKEARVLNIHDLPDPPSIPKTSSGETKTLAVWLPLVAAILILSGVGVTAWIITRKKKFAEVLDDWELEFSPQRISYKDLFTATKGFDDESLLGTEGFGKVYKGVLPGSKIEVAVKRVSHESRQGEKAFIAEVASLGKLRHRNLVHLLGYCRRQGELLLVYDFMQNGSLDKFLFRGSKLLDWNKRLQIIKSVASALFYLHEDYEQVVIHRDVKAGNVLLDGKLNAKLGDFGLARLYDHGTDPQTTHVVGTMGYLAPEFSRNGKATTATDVFAFGAFLLEVACGRLPIDINKPDPEVVLVDWVLYNWKRGTVFMVADDKLGGEFPEEEMEMVLKLGLLCSHPAVGARPSMRQVVQFLEGDLALPELLIAHWSTDSWPLNLDHHQQLSSQYVLSQNVSGDSLISFLSQGR